MEKNGKIYPGSEFSVIPEMHHNEFSDMCMLTPLWLARAVGVTGRRNPFETAKDVRDKTLAFLVAAKS